MSSTMFSVWKEISGPISIDLIESLLTLLYLPGCCLSIARASVLFPDAGSPLKKNIVLILILYEIFLYRIFMPGSFSTTFKGFGAGVYIMLI
jgi:hypothetical protein